MLPSFAVLINGNGQTFEGVGGVAPYTYSVLPGGVGGTIDSNTGVYTAPSSGIGVDIIEVVDSTLATSQVPVTVGSVLELFCDIIQKEMQLADDRIYIWDQKIMQPKDYGIYVVVGVMMCKPFGNKVEYVGDVGSMDEVSSVNMYANLTVDIFSRDTSAILRKEELIMALKSTYAEQQQNQNGFYIAKISNNFVNLSQVDGSAIPYRFQINVGIQYKQTRVRAIDYYDQFNAPTLDTDN